MYVKYDRLWKLLIDRHISRTELKEISGISTNAVAKMGKNENVSMNTLMKICNTLSCKVEDIIEIETGNDEND